MNRCPRRIIPSLLTVFADSAYQSRLEDIALEAHALELIGLPKPEGQSALTVLPERWLIRYRRLRADHESESTSSRG